MSDDIEEAKTYLRNLLTIFVHEHCDPVPEWAPLPDLVGMLTQIDNAITVTRDRQAEIARLREALAWVRKNYAGGNTAEINARIDAVLEPKP